MIYNYISPECIKQQESLPKISLDPYPGFFENSEEIQERLNCLLFAIPTTYPSSRMVISNHYADDTCLISEEKSSLSTGLS